MKIMDKKETGYAVYNIPKELDEEVTKIVARYMRAQFSLLGWLERNQLLISKSI
jgi:S-adenosylhomocysteine hydrolase